MTLNDESLLRKFEPVVRYTNGEHFFPCEVNEYVRRASLWLYKNNEEDKPIAAPGELNVQNLSGFQKANPGGALYLRFVDEPLNAIQYQRWLERSDLPRFQAYGRLARVGMLSRIIDSFFTMSLLVRGKVPGGTAAAAQMKYEEMQKENPRRVYYGRVLRVGGYTVLHYIFFFAMNDWRSTFYGVNDHEADWEQIFIYLAPDANDELQPQWVAYASHDFSGDDLRRRWDDPVLVKFGQTHPVVFAGAGSHASYFMQGEYLRDIQPDALKPVQRGFEEVARFWRRTLNQGLAPEKQSRAILGIPFVDYARGDGKSIGPGQDEEWTPILIGDDTPWVDGYRGLWGLETKDVFGGERAPSGPKYNRNGAVRSSWYDPLGWAGLDKVVPPRDAEKRLETHLIELNNKETTLEQKIEDTRERLRALALEVNAQSHFETSGGHEKGLQKRVGALENELKELQLERVQLVETQRAGKAQLAKIKLGDVGDPRAHLKHVELPAPAPDKQARIAEFWAAMSAGLLLLSLVGLLVFQPVQWLLGILIVLFLFGGIDAALRGYLSRYLLNATIILAFLTTLVLLKEFWRLALIISVAAIVFGMIRANLGEVRKR